MVQDRAILTMADQYKVEYGVSMVDCVAQLVERRSLTSELSLSCARPAADG